MEADITATYRVVTPMFLGGANPEEAEFRPASFKGALRFWWRALAWGRVCSQLVEDTGTEPDQEDVLGEIKEQEDWLFGSNAKQARVIFRAEYDPPEILDDGKKLRIPGSGEIVGDGARYFGYGVMGAYGKNKGTLTSGCIVPPFDFTVQAIFKPRSGEVSVDKFEVDLTNTLRPAMRAIGLFGGLGSKARKGYGSLTLLSLDGETLHSAPRAVREQISDLLDLSMTDLHGSDTPYTAFNADCEVYVGHNARSREPIKMLDRLGREMVRQRSWGFKGQLFGFDEKAERNYKPDHDLMKKAKRNKVDDHPDRVVFGLPHNYGKAYSQQVEPAQDGLERRASPLFLKIHQFDDDSTGFVLTFMPAKFLPKPALRVGKNSSVPLKEEGFWKPMRRYIERVTDKNNRRMSLTECQKCQI